MLETSSDIIVFWKVEVILYMGSSTYTYVCIFQICLRVSVKYTILS